MGGNPWKTPSTFQRGEAERRNDAACADVRDVPADGFWSVTVYNAKGFYEAPENAISVNNITGKRNADGSMTIRFGGDPTTENYLRIMPGWNYTVRLYLPRPES